MLHHKCLSEIRNLFWKNVGLRSDIQISRYLLPKLLESKLHFPHVRRQPVLPRDLSGHRKMIYLLIFLQIIKELILIGLIINITEPCDTESSAFCLLEIVMF